MRNCKSSVLFALLALSWQAALLAQTPKAYETQYFEQYQEALSFLKAKKTALGELFREHPGVDLKILLPALFPEIVRFSELQNKVESYSLEVLYVRFGTAYANFSIGRMQMKPSFAEALEGMAQDPEYKVSPSVRKKLQYRITEAKEVRKERIRRLNDWDWQVIYALAFAQISFSKYKLAQKTGVEQVRWLAGIYNRGLQHPAEDIKKWMQKRTFPHGPAYRGEQFIYSEIAVDFYQRYALDIFDGL